MMCSRDFSLPKQVLSLYGGSIFRSPMTTMVWPSHLTSLKLLIKQNKQIRSRDVRDFQIIIQLHSFERENSMWKFTVHFFNPFSPELYYWQAVLQNATLSLFAALYYNVNLMVLKKLC